MTQAQIQVWPYLTLYLPRPKRTKERPQLSAGTMSLYIREEFQPTSYGIAWGYVDTLVTDPNTYVQDPQRIAEIPDVSIKEKLDFIGEAFELKVTRVADILGVTRQAIYDWKKGKCLSDDNNRKLNELFKAAQRFKDAGLRLDYNTKHRNVGGDLDFIQALADQDPVQAVEKLVVVIERGKKQSAKLEKLLKDRPEPKGSILDELPPHYPGE